MSFCESFNLFLRSPYFNPIQDGGEKGRGGGAKKPSYQFFLCNFCKRRNEPPEISDF